MTQFDDLLRSAFEAGMDYQDSISNETGCAAPGFDAWRASIGAGEVLDPDRPLEIGDLVEVTADPEHIMLLARQWIGITSRICAIRGGRYQLENVTLRSTDAARWYWSSRDLTRVTA